MRGLLPRALLAAALLFAPSLAPAQVDVPRLTARVTDLTGTLPEGHRAALEQKLAAIEARKGSQVAVLMVPTVQPEAIEQYAIRVFDQWKLGRKNVDDGVLLVIAKNDRKLRIEVGRGLEGAIPDAIAKRIIDGDITPRFKQGDFYGGISDGIDRIGELIEGESLPAELRRSPRGSSSSGQDVNSDLIFFGFFAALVLAAMLQPVVGRLGGAAIASGVSALIAFVVSGVGLALLFAIGVFLLGLMGIYGGSGWSSGGGSWSSGGGGGSSGGGGFSGGGGGSSGGGASGSW